MKITEIITENVLVENQQLEEGWKQTLGALTMAAAAAVGGLHSGDASAADQVDIKAVQNASMCAGIMVGAIKSVDNKTGENMFIRAQALMNWAAQVARDTGVPKSVFEKAGKQGAERMEEIAASKNPQDKKIGLDLMQSCIKISNEILKDLPSNSKSAANATPQPKAQQAPNNQSPKASTYEPRQYDAVTGTFKTKSERAELAAHNAAEHKRQEEILKNLKGREAPKVKLSAAEQAYLDSLNAKSSGGQQTQSPAVKTTAANTSTKSSSAPSADISGRIKGLEDMKRKQQSSLNDNQKLLANTQSAIKNLKANGGDQSRISELEDLSKNLVKMIDRTKTSLAQTDETISKFKSAIENSYK